MCSLLYSSPEAILSDKWRGIFSSKSFSSRLVAVAIDEAHCVSKWYIIQYGTDIGKWFGLGGDDNNDPHKCKKIDLYFTPDLTSKLSVRLSKCLGREGARVG